MKRIGLLSDTHSYWDNRYEQYFASCDEIWHAGDIGSLELVDRFERFKAFRGVSGNCDGYEIRQVCPQFRFFEIEQVKVLMLHIGGYPGRYSPEARQLIIEKQPQLFVCGHSHILKVMYDRHYNCLTMNPGAAGLQGFQAVRTMLRFSIDGTEIKELEVVELG